MENNNVNNNENISSDIKPQFIPYNAEHLEIKSVNKEEVNNTDEKNSENKKPDKIKKKLVKKLKDNLQSFGNIFRQYPITIGSIVLASLLAAIIIDVDSTLRIYDWLTRIIFFLFYFSVGSLLTEEFFRHDIIHNKLKNKSLVIALKSVFFAVNAIISFAWDLVLVFDLNYFNDNLVEYFSRGLAVYIITIILVTVYLMLKRNNTTIESYALEVTCSLIKSTFVYGIIAIGFLIVLIIFNSLIYDTEEWELIGRVEIFIASGIYMPAIILSFSKVTGNISKFAKAIVEYVLLSLLIIAFLIVYLYIAKIIITFELPSNEVFNILTFLFAIGLPIWTFAMEFKEDFMGKIARFIPFAFAPFIILQAICVILRISQYGVTVSRYLGVAVIVFEIIYIALYCAKFGKYIDKMIFVTIAMVGIILVLPFCNMYAVTVKSQSSRIENIMNKGVEYLTDEEKKAVSDSFSELKYNAGCEGNTYIKENYTEELSDEITGWYYLSTDNRQYYSSQTTIDEIDISAYDKMSSLDSGYISGTIDITAINANTFQGTPITIDMTDIFEGLMEYDYDYLDNNNMFYVGEGRYVFLTYIHIEVENDEIQNLNFSGYIFE